MKKVEDLNARHARALEALEAEKLELELSKNNESDLKKQVANLQGQLADTKRKLRSADERIKTA